MTAQEVWFITGAARGMGIDIARAALDAGHAVVGTARDAHRVTEALGENEYDHHPEHASHGKDAHPVGKWMTRFRSKLSGQHG